MSTKIADGWTREHGTLLWRYRIDGEIAATVSDGKVRLVFVRPRVGGVREPTAKYVGMVDGLSRARAYAESELARCEDEARRARGIPLPEHRAPYGMLVR